MHTWYEVRIKCDFCFSFFVLLDQLNESVQAAISHRTAQKWYSSLNVLANNKAILSHTESWLVGAHMHQQL